MLASTLELPPDWAEVLADELDKAYFKNLIAFLAEERLKFTVFPPEDEIYAALHLTPFAQTRVLLLGQDPYPTSGHAHGLCFSVKPGVKHPGSLRNIFKELQADLGCQIPAHGNLEQWARQGVLMLNAVLTVREGEANSHAGKGWEEFTDAIILALNARNEPVVFVLWGNYAQKKGKLIDRSRHTIINSAHPSPLSVRKFSGSKPFSKVNEALKLYSSAPIDWQLDDIKS